MFSIVPNLLSSVPTFLFPVFASYKALKTSDPALLTPWLMYWVVLACALFVESWVGFILVWIPFYAWFRLFFLLYLILPQTQGARVLYQEHVHPFLQENENSIEDFITSLHDRIKASSLVYIQQIIDVIKQSVFGAPPKQPTPPPSPGATYTSYAQSLISRFNLPSARPQSSGYPTSGGTAGTAGDFYSLLASAVSAATGASNTADRTRDLSNSGTLIPPNVSGNERASFIAAQRERLTILLSALDKEASTLDYGAHSRGTNNPFEGSSGSDESSGWNDGLSTRKSEPDFERIDGGVAETENGRRQIKRGQSASGGGWTPWSWGAAKASEVIQSALKEEIAKGRSSGVDR